MACWSPGASRAAAAWAATDTLSLLEGSVPSVSCLGRGVGRSEMSDASVGEIEDEPMAKDRRKEMLDGGQLEIDQSPVRPFQRPYPPPCPSPLYDFQGHATMALVDYGSDSGSGSEDEGPLPVAPLKPVAAAPPPPTASSTLNPKKRAFSPSPPPQALPSASGIVLPPPKASSKRRLQTFAIEKVEKPVKDETDDGPPPPKQPKFTASSSGSALLSMLPPPKQEAPKAKTLPAPVRLKPLTLDAEGRIGSFDQQDEEEPETMDFSRKMPAAGSESSQDKKMEIVKPLSLSSAKGKGKAVSKAPEIDFFGLGSTTTPAPSTLKSNPTSTSSISSAPKVAPFRPPSPTPEDQYPGYYLHPHTKEWQAYEPDYYQSYFARWVREAGEEEDGGRAFEGLKNGGEELHDVSAQEATTTTGLPPVRPGTKAVPEVRLSSSCARPNVLLTLHAPALLPAGAETQGHPDQGRSAQPAVSAHQQRKGQPGGAGGANRKGKAQQGESPFPSSEYCCSADEAFAFLLLRLQRASGQAYGFR